MTRTPSEADVANVLNDVSFSPESGNRNRRPRLLASRASSTQGPIIAWAYAAGFSRRRIA